MLPSFIFALVIHAAISSAPCKDGVEITSQETKNPADIVGKWNYVYHWDSRLKDSSEFLDCANPNCPQLRIDPATPDYIKAKEAECTKNKLPFKWSDVILAVDAPVMRMNAGMIVIGEKDSWMVVDCSNIVRVVIKKFDDYIILINPDVPSTSELLAKVTPTQDELKCIAKNIDAAQKMKGFGICYKQ